MDNRKKRVLVVAHPDDEVLWFSSIASQVDKVIMCFLGGSGFTCQRKLAIRNHPLGAIVSLGLRQSGAFVQADWKSPIETDVGIDIVHNDRVRKRYTENFHALVKLLSPELRDCEEVFTHNPWGEYGHEEHIQIYRAVRTLQDAFGFDLWVDNYCGCRSITLLQEYLFGQYARYETHRIDSLFTEKLKKVYLQHGAWTWQENYEWFNEESFLLNLSKDSFQGNSGHLCPINLLRVVPKEQKQCTMP